MLSLINISLILCGIFINGLVFFKLWNWFIPPVFTNIPSLTITQSYGLILVVSFFRRNESSDTKDSKPISELQPKLYQQIFNTLFLFLIAYLFKITLY